MLVLNGLNDVRAHVGKDLGVSDWHLVTQEAIDDFARVTDDHQWIHVDVARSQTTSFGGTIAHGYYTLSLAAKFSSEIFTVEGIAFAINYGLNRVRFPSPMPVGQRIRMQARLLAAVELAGGLQITLGLTFECEGGEKPVCVAESLARIYAA